MGHRFAELAFTPSVREVQQALGSRDSYAAVEGGPDFNNTLGEQEARFIEARDSFYMASVGETGWPYVQHRGGPIGFVRVLNPRTLGFVDFRGNRQYVSTGNLRRDDRVALFFMDYPNRLRLKLLGRVEIVDLDSEQLAPLRLPKYRATVERGFVMHVEAFDWNCPQHITPRYTEVEIERLIAPLVAENRAFKEKSAASVPSVLGSGALELVITGIRQLTPRIRAFELRSPAGDQLPAIAPGSHLRVPVRLANGTTAIRHYSIYSDPASRSVYEIAVLLEENGAGGSQAIHESFHLGLRLRCDFAESYFPAHDDTRPALLIAGGIGVTPIVSIAYALQRRGVDIRVHYAARSLPDMALREQMIRDFPRQLSLYSSANGQRMDVQRLVATASDETVFYVCGPNRLIDAVTEAASAAGIGADRLRVERFNASIPVDAKPVRLELRRSGKTLNVPANQTLLDAMLAAGVDAPYGCKAGDCKTCAVRVLDGEPDHRDAALSTAEREQGHLMCPCISRARSDALTLDL